MPDHIPTRAGIDLIRDAAQDAAEGSLVSVRKDLLQAFAARLDEAERLLGRGEKFWQHNHACPMLQPDLAWDIRNCTCGLVEFVVQLEHFRGR